MPFWAAVFSRTPRHVNDQFVALDPEPDDPQPGLLFQKVAEPKLGKNRVHVDVRVDDMSAEIDRLVGLGATVLAQRSMGSFHWTVLADPEGNEFCVNAG